MEQKMTCIMSVVAELCQSGKETLTVGFVLGGCGGLSYKEGWDGFFPSHSESELGVFLVACFENRFL